MLRAEIRAEQVVIPDSVQARLPVTWKAETLQEWVLEQVEPRLPHGARITKVSSEMDAVTKDLRITVTYLSIEEP